MQWCDWWHHQHHGTGNMLLLCTNQKVICSSNITYKPHVPISSCAHMTQLCQYIYLILTQLNQQCDQEHRYTYMSHYWHMPLNKYACDIVHICPTALILWPTCRHILLYIQVQKTTFHNRHSTNYRQICARHKYAPQMPHIQSPAWPGALLYIYFTLLAYAPEQICLPYLICMSHCIKTVLYMNTQHHCTYRLMKWQTTNFIYHTTAIYVPTANMLSNATYMLNLPITSWVHMGHLCQWVYIIWTQCNQ